MKNGNRNLRHLKIAGGHPLLLLLILLMSSCVTYAPSIDIESIHVDRSSIPESVLLSVKVESQYTGFVGAMESREQVVGLDSRSVLQSIGEELFGESSETFIASGTDDPIDIEVNLVTDRRTAWLGSLLFGASLMIAPAPMYNYPTYIDIRVLIDDELIASSRLEERVRKLWLGVAAPFAPLFVDAETAVARAVAGRLSEIFADPRTTDRISEIRGSRRVAPETRQPEVPSSGSGSLLGYGTGFAIADDGFVLTNMHVISGARSVSVQIGTQEVEATVVATDSELDLALLKVDHSMNALPFSVQPQTIGTPVFTIGFPNPDIQGFSPKYTNGTISATSGIQDDPRVYQISVPLQPGNSGGAVVSTEGQVVGVAVARLSDVAVFGRTGALPQNVNYAIKSTRLIAFLLENGIPLNSEVTDSQNVTEQLVEDSTFLIRTFD